MPASPKPERVIDKVRRHIQRRDTKAAEDRIMRQVRAEDRYCRFPLCGCGRMKLALDVAHAGEDGHRGMGGNRSLSKTTPENLILLCRPRHRAHKFSVDKKNVKAVPLTAAGLRGPVRWWIDFLEVRFSWMVDHQDAATLPEWFNAASNWREIPDWPWVVVATEVAPHRCEPLTDRQRAILEYLATMEH